MLDRRSYLHFLPSSILQLGGAGGKLFCSGNIQLPYSVTRVTQPLGITCGDINFSCFAFLSEGLYIMMCS